MKAILLAAGRGRRLGVDEPKCLLRIAGRTLLERHLDNLHQVGIGEVIVVMGHEHAKLEAALDTISVPIKVTRRFNELYPHGSLVSLQCAGEHLTHGSLWMDADVLYPAALLAELVDSPQPNCVLLDGRSSEQGEEMMLGARAGRVHRIARHVGAEWELVGESVGFFKVDSGGGAVLKSILDAEVAAGRLDQEHEDALNLALPRVQFGYERADAFPWTEIDFPADVAKAEDLARSI